MHRDRTTVSEDARTLLASLRIRPRHFDYAVEITGLSAVRVARAALELEIAALATRAGALLAAVGTGGPAPQSSSMFARTPQWSEACTPLGSGSCSARRAPVTRNGTPPGGAGATKT
jgi:hypothetical protein